MQEILISPSDLSYFWSDSKVGFYDKYVLKINRPKQAFPSVFNTIDLAMKDCFDKKQSTDFLENIPKGEFLHDEIYVKSRFIEMGDFKIGFKGKIDCLLKHGDSYSIVDYKTTHLSNKLNQIYFLQLMAYAFCLENPDAGSPKKIDNLGLIVFQPETFHSSDGKAALNGSLHYVEIPFDKNKFKKWMKDDLLPLLTSEREKIVVSSNDQSWQRYVNCFYLEDDEQNAHK
jgi:PD-(D/E)XK nuclease superfamily